MEKILEFPFYFLEQLVNKVVCRFIDTDSEQQKVLTCDLYRKADQAQEQEQDVLVYADKAYILGEQPFTLTEEEITELSK